MTGTIAHRAFTAAILGSICIVLLCAAFPARVEGHVHRFVVAQVEAELANRPRIEQSPATVLRVRQTLESACRFCSPRRPSVFGADTPYALQFAMRDYLGLILDVFVAIVAPILGYLAILLLAALLARGRPASWRRIERLAVVILLSELLVGSAFVLAPGSFVRAVGRPAWLELAMCWLAVLLVWTIASFFSAPVAAPRSVHRTPP